MGGHDLAPGWRISEPSAEGRRSLFARRGCVAARSGRVGIHTFPSFKGEGSCPGTSPPRSRASFYKPRRPTEQVSARNQADTCWTLSSCQDGNFERLPSRDSNHAFGLTEARTRCANGLKARSQREDQALGEPEKRRGSRTCRALQRPEGWMPSRETGLPRACCTYSRLDGRTVVSWSGHHR